MASTTTRSRRRTFLPLVVAAAAAACGREPPPNIVLFTLDTFRTDRVGAYGNESGLTQTLDDLAARSIVFDVATTPIGTTHPAHASLFTGLYPGDHGVRFNGDGLDERFVTLAQYLEAAGYDTAAYVSKYSLIHRAGLGRGFQEVNQEHERADAYHARGEMVNQAARKWMRPRNPGDGPFFLWVHYFDTHSPYPPSGSSQRRMRSYQGPYEHGASIGTFYAFGKSIPATPENRAALEALYDGQVARIDDLVGGVFGDLRRRGLLENTVVILTADHGQMLGEHGYVGHGWTLHEPVLSVPLMIWWPGRTVPRRVAERVSLVDLFPTILELAGLEPPAGIAGRSLVGVIRGEPLEEQPYFASVRIPKIRNEGAEQPDDKKTVAVYWQRFKLVLDDDGMEVYDLVADPGEQTPLPDGEEREALLQRLVPLALEHRHRERPRAEPTELAPEVLEELRALGYVR